MGLLDRWRARREESKDSGVKDTPRPGGSSNTNASTNTRTHSQYGPGVPTSASSGGQSGAASQYQSSQAAKPPSWDVTTLDRGVAQRLSAAGWTVDPKYLGTPTEDTLGGEVQEIKQHGYELSEQQVKDLGNSLRGAQGIEQRNMFQDKRINNAVSGSRALTWDEYNAMSDAQRKAVDANTMLLAARERDLANPKLLKDLDEETRTAYEERAGTMFKEGYGSAYYAPETVALLESWGLGNDHKYDLDEYLSLERGVDAEEIKGLDLKGADSWKSEKPGDFLSMGAIKSTDYGRIEEAGKLVMQTLQQEDVWGQVDAVRKLAGINRGSDIPYGYANDASSAMESELAFGYNQLYNRALDVMGSDAFYDSMMEASQGVDWTDENWDALMDYMDRRTRKDIQAGTDYGTGRARDAQGIRDMLGLDSGDWY